MIENVLNFFKDLISELGRDYQWKGIDGDIPCDNYMMCNIVPFERVQGDQEKCIKQISMWLSEMNDKNEKELLIAIYVNFCIKYGMVERFESEDKKDQWDGLDSIFHSLSDEEYFRRLYKKVKYQEDNWEDILEENKSSIVAKLYIFVKLCVPYAQEAMKANEKVLNVDKFEKMWELYETIPNMWQEYLIGKGSLCEKSSNYAFDDNLLPFVQFVSIKEILMEYIQKYYFSILDKLCIEHNISSNKAYYEIINKLGFPSIKERFGNCSKDVKTFIKTDIPELIPLIVNSIMQFRKANEDKDLIFLIEKIHLLQYDEFDESDEFDEFSEIAPVDRQLYLQIGVIAPIKRSLFLSQYNEYRKNRIVKRNIQYKKEMMDYYAHSWKHISYPQIVKEIAEELGDTNRRLSNKLMKAYNSERTLQRGIQLLQFISSEDDSKVSKEFKSGMAKFGADSDGVITLMDIICDSLDLVMFKMLMVESDDSSSMIRCRDKWKMKRSLEILREEYTDYFLDRNSNRKEIVGWINDNFIEIDLSIKDEWNDVRFKEDSFSANQFKEIMVEIFTNVFLHGENKMQLEFFNNDIEMVIHEVNDCSDSMTGSKSGISTMERVLDCINYNTDIDSINIDSREKYELTIKINKKVLIRKGR